MHCYAFLRAHACCAVSEREALRRGVQIRGDPAGEGGGGVLLLHEGARPSANETRATPPAVPDSAGRGSQPLVVAAPTPRPLARQGSSPRCEMDNGRARGECDQKLPEVAAEGLSPFSKGGGAASRRRRFRDLVATCFGKRDERAPRPPRVHTNGVVGERGTAGAPPHGCLVASLVGSTGSSQSRYLEVCT
eukprot:4271782-Pyramimonas_sp.AAC.1